MFKTWTPAFAGATIYRASIRLVATALLSGAASGLIFAFESVQIESISAGAVIGAPATPFEFLHKPLPGVSVIKKVAIIQGEVGQGARLLIPVFTDRRTIASDPYAGDDRIRVTGEYQFISPQGVEGPIIPLPPIDGPNPFSWAYQVDPDHVVPGVFRYRLFAFNSVDGSSVSIPSGAIADSDLWIVTSVLNQAAAVIGPAGGRVVINDGNPNDGQSSLEIPGGMLSQTTVVSIDEVTSNFAAVPGFDKLRSPVAVYRLGTDPPAKGPALINLLYQDFNFFSGQDGLVDGTSIKETDLAIVWWDGHEWRRMGGRPNVKDNTLQTRAGLFNYVAIAAAGPVSPQDRRPMERTITPNGDGLYDEAVFDLGDIADGVQVEIFDVTGRRIRTINSLSTFMWDGRDDNGRIVESGVYIYQYKVEGQLISGLIAVAK